MRTNKPSPQQPPKELSNNLPLKLPTIVQRLISRRTSLMQNHVALAAPAESRGGSRSQFKAAAKSVLSHPANRKYMQEQKADEEKAKRKSQKRLVLGSRTYTVDDDDLTKLVKAPPEVSKASPTSSADEVRLRKVSKSSSRRSRQMSYPPRVSKRDSTMSMTSTCSVDSDWSDEELEEFEKIFGDIQSRLNEAQCDTGPEEGMESNAANWWRTLKKSRLIAMQKMKRRSSESKRNRFSTSSCQSLELEEIEDIMDSVLEEEEEDKRKKELQLKVSLQKSFTSHGSHLPLNKVELFSACVHLNV